MKTTWKRLGTAKYDGTCCLCGDAVRARKDHAVYLAPHIAHESCHDHAVEHRHGVALDLPAYVSDAERARIETGRPTWAAKLIEIDVA